MFRLLGRLLRGPRLEHLHFVLFTRQGCHLCEEAERRLQREKQRYNFKLEIVDVVSQEELAAQFGDQVPVVTVNGQIRFRGGINPILLTRLLRAEIHRKA